MSIVRENMLKRRGYTPYCGSVECYLHGPRASFNGQQMTCRCGWQSEFEPEFIEQYKAAQAQLATDGAPYDR